MDDKTLIQALRLALFNKKVEDIKKVEFYNKNGRDMISFIDNLNRKIIVEVTIDHESRQSTSKDNWIRNYK